MSLKLLIDSDILLDAFLDRAPFSQSAFRLLTLLQNRKFNGYCTPIIFSDIYYLHSQKEGKISSLEKLKEVRKVLELLTVTQSQVDSALLSDFPDFEDAIQYYSALENSMNFIITRNKKDFGKSVIPVMTAEEFIDFYHATR